MPETANQSRAERETDTDKDFSDEIIFAEIIREGRVNGIFTTRYRCKVCNGRELTKVIVREYIQRTPNPKRFGKSAQPVILKRVEESWYKCRNCKAGNANLDQKVGDNLNTLANYFPSYYEKDDDID